MPSQEAAIAAVQFRVSHLPLHRSSVPLRFELITGAVLAATIADETLREFRGQYI